MKPESEKIARISEMVSSVQCYFELKNLALRNAMSIRCPLSPGAQKDLRLYYSQYFSGLLSAIDLLLEPGYEHRESFKSALEDSLSFGGSYDGAKSYLYLRELRNSAIHRGMDLCSAAHIQQDFPMYIAPETIDNRSRTASYKAFGYYLIDIVKKCESAVGGVFFNHLQEYGLLSIRLPDEEIRQRIEEFVGPSFVIPKNIKGLAIESAAKINHEDLHQYSVARFI